MKKTILISLILFISIWETRAQQIGDGWAPVITDFGGLLTSGVYNCNYALGRTPDDSYDGWQHLFVIRHPNNTNNHQFQLATSFTENDRLFFRKIALQEATPKSPDWFEIATRGTNIFSGDQSINGNQSISGNLYLGLNGGISTISGPYSSGAIQIKNNPGLGGPENRYLRLGWIDGNSIFSPVLSINDDLYVGIGTTTPSEKLEIFNSSTTPGTLSLRSERNDAGHVDVGRISAKQGLYEVARIGMPRAGGTYTGYLTFWTKETNDSELTERLRISTNGNVGIGTTETGTHRLAVEGTIGAREIKVEAGTWSDFVFDDDYNLKNIEEVEKFIEENNHLPNIPSANEVKENGINLGEMDAKLLQKIEELTLYMIDVNKKIQSLQSENEKLKEEIKIIKGQ